MNRAIAASWFPHFLLWPSVSRVKRRMDMRSVLFERSMCDVQMRSFTGSPVNPTRDQTSRMRDGAPGFNFK